MAAKKSKNTLIDVINNLFTNFPRLLLTNLLFAVPFALFYLIFAAINTFSGINSNLIIFLTIIPLFPFYAGVVQVTAHMTMGEESVPVVSNFVAAVKENFLRFLVHGVVFYCAIVFSYYSISIYAANLEKNPVLFLFLAISVIAALVFLFMFFYLPSMTVTFDISMKNIYKNSFLMSFGEIKHNLSALFGLFLLLVFCTTIMLCCIVEVAIIIATIVISLFLLPSVVAFIINSATFGPMYNIITDKDSQKKSIDQKIENKRGKLSGQDKSQSIENESEDDFSGLDIDESKDGDEYIFYNGKMVKRSVILKMRKESEERKDD